MTKHSKLFSFTDLSMIDGAEDGPRSFDGMAAGTFIDMWGREFTFDENDLPLYVANTKRALESTRDGNGEIVGFPIDQMNHYPGMAAGWITDVNLAMGRAVVEFTPRWTEWGKEHIGNDELRFFSPSIDTESKTIIGGSLTNWPATRTAEHEILLRPVELSEQISMIEPQPVTSLFADLKQWITDLFKAGAKPTSGGFIEIPPNGGYLETIPGETIIKEPVMPDPIELSAEQRTQLEALVSERANALFQQMVEQEQRKTRILDFTRTVTGKGLPVEGEDLTAFLSSLNPDQLEKAEAILSKCAEVGRIDFEEHGHSKTMTSTQPLPDPIKASLRTWIADGHSVDEFFKINAVELGAMADYNLSEFEPKEK